MTTYSKDSAWLHSVKEHVPQFLERLQGHTPGFYHYSLSGDLIPETTHWGLGNTVFAIKIYQALGMLDALSIAKKEELIRFVMSFQTRKGYLFDPLVARKTWLIDKLFSFRHVNFNNFWHQETIRAETRQSLSALKLLSHAIVVPSAYVLTSTRQIDSFLSRLHWRQPWNAGSHFSHLLFFLFHSDLPQKQELIAFAIQWIKKIQHDADGVWYWGNPSLQQKINGAMKVITGLKVVNQINLLYPNKIIDLCLSARNDAHACDNFNIVYVLKYACEQAPGYRTKEIQSFAFERLNIYQQYYYPSGGGFSFSLGRANTHYYGAHITRGKNEPDIHGTVMFLWGSSLIAQLLELSPNIRLNELIS